MLAFVVKFKKEDLVCLQAGGPTRHLPIANMSLAPSYGRQRIESVLEDS